MLNFMIILVPALCQIYSFYFLAALFGSLAILRFKCNRNKSLFVVALLGTFFSTVLIYHITHIFVIQRPLPMILGIQFIIVSWSLLYNWKKKLWRRDIVFFVMEPSLMIILGAYFVIGGFTFTIHNNLLTWLYVYIGVQAFLLVLKLSIGYKLASRARGLLDRIKLVISYLPHIKPSFGLQDFSVSTGVSYFYQPTHLDNVMNELKFAENMIFAEMSGKVAEKEKLKKEREKLLGDNSGFARFLKTLSN